jgi:hypothetical protein
MMPTNALTRRIVVLVAILFASLVNLAQVATAAPSHAKEAGEFRQRAKQYLDLREKTGGKAPSPADSPEKLLAARRELANRIRVRRAGTTQGEIFTPQIAEYFRRQISTTLNGRSGADVRSTLRHAEPVKMELQINQSYPEDVPLQSSPPTLLLNLPELPKGLEYRILGRELVLRDTDANIVVDYVPNALPETKQ